MHGQKIAESCERKPKFLFVCLFVSTFGFRLTGLRSGQSGIISAIRDKRLPVEGGIRLSNLSGVFEAYS